MQCWIVKKKTLVYADIMILIAFTGLVGEFDILVENISTQGMAYDYKSVMHPGLYAFAKGKHKTIVPLNSTGHLYRERYPTALDIFHIKIMYCEGNRYSICN